MNTQGDLYRYRGEVGGLTLWGGAQLLFEGVEHLHGEGLTLLPDINEFSDLVLQKRKEE